MTRAAVEITRRKAIVEVIQRNGVRVVRVTTPGPRGPRGAGVPAGGTLGQVLRRAAGADYSTVWGTLTPADVGADPAGTAASGVAAHLAASDPHPQYTTPAEAAAAAPVQAVSLAAPSGWSTSTSNSGGNVTLTLALPTGTSLVSSGDRVAWDQAAATALRWDGSATGLDAAAGRASLGLGTAAQSAASDFATAAQGALAATAVQPAALSTGLAGKVDTSDSRLSDAREWSAATISQADAEAGTGTERRAFTAQRVFQAIASWWSSSAAAAKLAGIASGATANATDAQLRDRATHTGTQSVSTITGLATVATSGNYGDLINRPNSAFTQAPFQGLTPCANNLQFPNINLFSQDGSVTPVVRTYRTGHEILTSGSIIRLAWINQLFNGSVTNSYALEAGVQLSNTRSADLSATTITRLRFNGATSITVQPNQVVISDPIYLDVEPGQFLFVRSCLTSTAASNNWPTGPWCFQSNEGIATGNQVTNLSQSFSNFTVGVAPILISSQSSDGRWLAAYGDSILDGSSDVINSRGFFPLWQSAARIKGTRNSNPGERITNFLSRIPLRFQNTSGATHALFEYGTNDVANGDSLSTIQSNLIASWRILWKMNQAVYQTTILPRASSTDGWTTAQNQTITNASQETVRTSLNDWLRAGAPVTASATSPFFVPASIGAANSLPCPYLSRVLDWCQAVEVDTSNQITANGGRWIVGSTLRSGTATGGSTTSITDIAAGFTSIVTSYGGAVVGCFVRITAGAGAGQTNWIIGATSTSISLLNTWSVAANNTSVYEIIDTATRDAVHPSANTHLRIANWLTSNLAALP